MGFSNIPFFCVTLYFIDIRFDRVKYEWKVLPVMWSKYVLVHSSALILGTAPNYNIRTRDCFPRIQSKVRSQPQVHQRLKTSNQSKQLIHSHANTLRTQAANNKRPISISCDLTMYNTHFASRYRAINHSFLSVRCLAMWQCEQRLSFHRQPITICWPVFKWQTDGLLSRIFLRF